MTIAYSALREGISRLLGDFLQCTTTTLITGTDAYIISTELARFPLDSHFDPNWWMLITSGNNIGVRRAIKAYTAASYKLEVYGANLAAETVQVTFELHRFDPDEIKAMLNQARLEAFPLLAVQVLAPNDHFEDWSQTAYPDHWRVSGVTAVKETTTVHQNGAGATVTRAGTDGYLYISTSIGHGEDKLPLDVYRALLALRGQKVKFGKWVLTSVAGQARLRIYCGSESRSRWSKYHSGDSKWQFLEVEFDIPHDASEVGFRCEVNNTNGSVHFDGAGSAEKAPLYGAGYLSSVDADADEMELDTNQALGLEYWAAALILQNCVMPVGSEAVGRYAGDSGNLMARAMRLLRAHRSILLLPRIHYGWLRLLKSEG